LVVDAANLNAQMTIKVAAIAQPNPADNSEKKLSVGFCRRAG